MVFGIRVVVSKERKGKTKKDAKNITKKVSNIVISIDRNKQISKYNKKCEDVLGFTKKEAINKQIFDMLIPINYNKQWEKIINYSNKKRKIHDFKLPFLDNKGQEVWISWSYFPVMDANGELVDINLVGSLVTDEDTADSLIEIPLFEQKKEINKPIKTICVGLSIQFFWLRRVI